MILADFQKLIKEKGYDAFIVTRNNMFLGQDILPEENKLRALTGFSGSAGNLLVFPDRAVLFVDGRYELQAAREVDAAKIEVVVTRESIATWLQNNVFENLKIAYNPWCHSVGETDYWNRILKRFNFVEDKENLLGIRPADKECNIFEHDVRFAGISMDEKISMLTPYIQKNKCDAYFLAACDSVSWLLNLRSNCLPDTPILRAFALISAQGEVSLFANDFTKLREELANYNGKTIGMAYNNTPRAVFSLMKEQNIWVENVANPILNWKAVKNPVELDNVRQAHRRDAVAVCSFLHWLEQNAAGKTELDIVEKLYAFRKQGQNFFSNSFETIAGFAENGAVIHYQPTEETNLTLKDGSLLLLDSGAQYYDGTTDITRTVAVGTPSREMADDFTTVLKAHISLSSALFPEGTSGQTLDVLSRSLLWRQGKDYNHGTGHGVGFFLNVHEGPQSISSRSSQTPLQPGMIVSIEPGYYRAGHYGIRIENLVEIQTAGTETPMLCFRPLTLVPLDKRLINKYLLTEQETAWVNDYHSRVWTEISPLLDNQNVRNWLKDACTPL